MKPKSKSGSVSDNAAKRTTPANYKWIPPEWENMTEAERAADFFKMCKNTDYGEGLLIP